MFSRLFQCHSIQTTRFRIFFSNISRWTSSCPFDTLGLTKNVSYKEVKKTFLRLAIQSHPDTSKSKGGKDNFLRYRAAFESLTEGKKGEAKPLNDDMTSSMPENDFEEWYHHETGYHVPYANDVMQDTNLMREIAKATEGMSQGGLDKGGMWQLAASVRERLKNGNLPPPMLATGKRSTDDTSGSVKRRRRRKQK